jgi:cell division septum initiation protein DivIVA
LKFIYVEEILEENHKLKEKIADLDRELYSAKEQISYLQKMYR